jgi:predicted transcriptional regulator|tara:strand:+ start:354 stop:752 length:399 start_codon:yes stop_codon:yes gene_type:complete
MKPKNKVVRLRKNNPFMTTAEIARQVGISRQYAKEILDKNNLQSNVPKARNVVYCKVCDKPIMKGERSRGKVHADGCAFIWNRIRLKCNWCRTIFYRTKKRVRRGVQLKLKNVYCTTECYQNYRKYNQNENR